MNWMESLAERRILQAQQEGLFDNLPGRGKPLPPDPFASLHPELRLAARVLFNSGYAPEEVGLLRDLKNAQRGLAGAGTALEKARAMREYREAELRYNMAMERHRRLYK